MISDEEILRRLEAADRLGSNVAAAKELGIDESNIRRAREAATRRNLTGEWLGGTLPQGYLMGKVTRHVLADGTVKEEWARQSPREEAFQQFVDDLIVKMQAEITPLPEAPAPAATRLNTLTLYPVVDVHLGQFSWGKETGGNYDLKIAKEQFQSSVSRLMAKSPNSEQALIVVLGDYFHANDNDAQTKKSKHHLDVDGRHDKVLFLGVELLIWTIDMALQKHAHIVVHIKRGNHDPEAHKALLAALWFRYMGNPRVEISRDPRDLFVFEYGINMLGFTHGDELTAAKIPGAMAAFYPEEWGRTIERYGFSGHFHKEVKFVDEHSGAVSEILPAFTEKDAWNRGKGHSSMRGLVSITFNKYEGRDETRHQRIK